jgi:hypothetical protein
MDKDEIAWAFADLADQPASSHNGEEAVTLQNRL